MKNYVFARTVAEKTSEIFQVYQVCFYRRSKCQSTVRTHLSGLTSGRPKKATARLRQQASKDSVLLKSRCSSRMSLTRRRTRKHLQKPAFTRRLRSCCRRTRICRPSPSEQNNSW